MRHGKHVKKRSQALLQINSDREIDRSHRLGPCKQKLTKIRTIHTPLFADVTYVKINNIY